MTTTQTNRPPFISPTAGLRVLWSVIRFLLVSYAFMFGKAARSLRHAGSIASRRHQHTPDHPPA